MPEAVLDPLSVPARGAVVHFHSHRWLVEDVEASGLPGGDTVVRMTCLDDDANGQKLEVLWQREVDAQVDGSNRADFFADTGGCRGVRAHQKQHQ
jgi:hypothetical protein